MIQWIKDLKNLIKLSRRIGIIESEIEEIECRYIAMNAHFGLEFEKKMQKLTFDYTNNLDDTKSQYLKRYVEVRMDCMQRELKAIPKKIEDAKESMKYLLTQKNEEHE
jgi:hypothetical protein